MDRRRFLAASGATVGGLMLPGFGNAITVEALLETMDPARMKAIADLALSAATSAGASYCDVRVGRYLQQSIQTRETRVRAVTNSESTGVGIRVIAKGTWGFAATSDMSNAGIVKAARQAVAIAKANAVAQTEPVRLAPVKAAGEVAWATPIAKNGLLIPVKEKADLLLAANAAAIAAGANFVNSQLFLANACDMAPHAKDGKSDNPRKMRTANAVPLPNHYLLDMAIHCNQVIAISKILRIYQATLPCATIAILFGQILQMPISVSLAKTLSMSQTSVARARSGLPLKIKECRAKVHMREAHTQYQKFVISLPKCGRTWHRIMLGYYLTQIAGVEASRALDLDALCGLAGVDAVTYSHNNTCYTNRFPVDSPVFASAIEWRDRDVLLLVRNPCDVLVSAYHHARYRYGRFDGTLGDFVRGENTGILKVLSAYHAWHARRS